MANKQIRVGQLIAPFGPGSLYTDRRGIPHIICGLDHWYQRYDPTSGLVQCESREEFERFEPRLSALLQVSRFCIPPDYRYAQSGKAPPNALLHIPVQRFPRWYRNTRTGKMHQFNLHTERIENPTDGGRWQPVRFIAVCAAGHLSDFPWKKWIDCDCLGDDNLFLTDRGGSELDSIRIECRSCRKSRTLAGTTANPNELQGDRSAFQRAGITCSGEQPWHGEGASEPACPHPLVGVLINQTNLYFPRVISAITLPDLRAQSEDAIKLRAEIEQESTLGIARAVWNMGKRVEASAMIRAGLSERGIDIDDSNVQQVLESIFDLVQASLLPDAAVPIDPESELLAFRRAEYNIIRNHLDEPTSVPDLRVISTSIPAELAPWFARVNLVERLREMRVFYGFDRLVQETKTLDGMPDTAMHQLFRNPPAQPQDYWLPAIEVFGEGIYVELNEEQLVQWQKNNTEWLENRLDIEFIARLGGVHQCMSPLGSLTRDWASRYLLVHSLSHILINQFVFECGYSTASLRERLFVSSDKIAPMAAFLIYTAAGDSEGTLGGLVRLGASNRLGAVVRRAISRASWCSADPVCSEHLGGQGSRLANLAACQSCILLPETSCETINQGLDRAMIVGTSDSRENGFMIHLIQETYTE